ncbi:MAG TPA: YtxH domain-containing protein [Ktedonobacterales bacterium]|nr:YtxH domain-containing protein [Ktedonobacterales bacterium]
MAKNGNGKSSGGGRFFWFVCGLAIGAGLAVLFAPQPGEETRKQLAEQAELFTKRGRLDYDQIVQTFRERANDAIVLGKEAYSRSKDEVSTRYQKAKSGA